MDDTVIKLQQATDRADAAVKECFEKFKKSEEAVRLARVLLKDLSEDEQQRIRVTDTMLPELLGMLQIDTEAYETAVKRHETNKRYLERYKTKHVVNEH